MTKGSRDVRNLYFYEYAIADMIDKYNAGHMNTRIMTSEARAIHDRIVDKLGAKGVPLHKAVKTDFISACNDVCTERMGGQNPYPEKKYLDDQITAFTEFDGVIPISPYDKRFSDRDTIRQNGSSILFVREDDVGDNVNQLSNFVRGRKFSLYKMTERNGQQKYDVVGNLTTKADLMGTSRLMGYMTQDEYDTVVPWIESGYGDIDWGNMSDEEAERIVASRRDAMDRSAAILDGLRNMNIPYSIVKDMSPGQVRAELDGTKIQVRITDTPANQHYVGRVYDNGCSIYYSTTRREQGTTVRYNNPTPEDCLNLVRFALNKPVMRKDSDKFVGETDTYDISWYKKSGTKWNKSIVTNNAAVQTAKTFTAVAGPYLDEKGQPDKFGHKIIIRSDLSDRSARTTYFKDEQAAQTYLRDAVTSARENFTNAVDAERIINEYEAHKDEEDYVPVFSGDQNIAIIQQGYWNLLTGVESELLIPGESAEEYEQFVGDVGEYRNGTPAEQAVFNAMSSGLVYDHEEYPTPQDMIRQHAKDNVNYAIGSYELDDTGKRFDPVGVATYQTSAYGTYRNNDDIVAALKLTNISPDELKGNDFYNQVLRDRLIEYNPDTAFRMDTHESRFVRNMGAEIYHSLQRSGCEVNPEDILMDENGIVEYKAKIYTRQGTKAGTVDTKEITGQIGQIFIPENGMIETKFAGTPNYICVPGYEATILPQKPGETKGVAERTRLRGYYQMMTDRINYQIRQDLLGARTEVGSPTSCNGVYRQLYDERHPLDFMEQYRQQGMDDSLAEAIIRTEACRVRYSNAVRDGSTINADYNATQYGSTDMNNDNFNDPYCITGGKNMSIMDEDGDGYFDPVATGTSTNQGITRYLVEGATVSPTGEIIPSDDLNDRTPLMKHDVAKFMEYNPFDRQQMTVSNLLQASAVTKPVKIAQMTFGGWTQDDPVVISKHFAQSYQIRNHDGEMRDLVIGDKVSDLNGNKGVISLVVDPDIDLEEAERQGIREQVEWFRANPDLDVVMAPFPAVSRFNGGSTRELMQNPSDLIAPDGTVKEGCIGEARMIITDKAADIKTHIYDDEEVQQGKGRKVSAQLAWALNAQHCPAIMSEVYGSNSGATTNLREMLITMGLDMDETGTLRTEYKPHEGEKRKVFEMPELRYTASGALDIRKMTAEFGDKIGTAGGVMEVPFPLDYATGAPMPPMNDGKTDVIYEAKEWERKGYYRKDGTYVRPTTVHRHDDAGTSRQTSDVTYGVPVLSSYLRSGQEFEDGTSSVHDYTNQYLAIFEHSARYMDAKNRLADPKNANDPNRSRWEKTLETSQTKAQAAYNNIANDIERRRFEGKHNVFRDDLMAHKMPNSATSVWTADPRLDIDQIAMGTAMAEALNVKDNGHVLVWRDPALRDSCTRYMRVKIDDNLTGVAISPVMDKCFDGDFDGDTVGLWNPRSKAARKEAMEKLTVEANLLDYGSKNEEGLYDLAMQNSLDIKVAQHNNPELAQRWDKLTREVNELEALRKNDEISDESYFRTRQIDTKELSDYYRDCYKDQCGKAVVSYKSMPDHIDSLVHSCVETGAKGNMNKIKDYLKYLGVECELKNDKFDYSTLRDNGKTLATRQDMQDVEYATAVKAFGTGVAGMYSQRGVRGLRNDCCKAVLELTYPVTQSILQAKHDPIDARHKYQMLMGPCKQLWKGAAMEFNPKADTWLAQKDDKGQIIQADKEQWKKQFIEIYKSDIGLNVNVNEDYINHVADAMCGPDGKMLSIEDGAAQNGALMDRLAYGGTFKNKDRTAVGASQSLINAAKNGENLFDGKYNSMFAPKTIITNKQIVNDKIKAGIFSEHDLGVDETKTVKAIVKGDVKEDSVIKNKKSPVAVGGKFKPSVNDLNINIDSNGEENGPKNSGHGDFGD